jgi:hypothetical protein
VPFWFQGLRPPPLTSRRVFALCVPCGRQRPNQLQHRQQLLEPILVKQLCLCTIELCTVQVLKTQDSQGACRP